MAISIRSLASSAWLALSALCLTATIAGSQQTSSAGQWQCRHASQSRTNNPFDIWTYEFVLSLSPNGAFRAEGSYYAMSAGFSVATAAQGQWQEGVYQQTGRQALMLQGQETQQDGTNRPFVLVFLNVTQSVLSNNQEGPAGPLLSYCQRM